MAYPTEKQVRDGLVTVLSGVTGLHPLPYASPGFVTPAVLPAMRWPLQQSYGKRAGPIDCDLHVLVKYGVGAGQTLGEYTDPEGAKSIAAAIQATPTLGVSGVTGTRLVEVGEERLFSFPDGSTFWGRTIRLQIFI